MGFSPLPNSQAAECPTSRRRCEKWVPHQTPTLVILSAAKDLCTLPASIQLYKFFSSSLHSELRFPVDLAMLPVSLDEKIQLHRSFDFAGTSLREVPTPQDDKIFWVWQKHYAGLRNGFGSYRPSLKSRHAGFIATINAIFLILSNPLICFSRDIALPTY
jgi:hypothetical protein